MGLPEPNITWYKNNVLLEGRSNKTLVIQEVEINDRGRYRCAAENMDPNDQMIFRDDSEEVVVNIIGTWQKRYIIACMILYSHNLILCLLAPQLKLEHQKQYCYVFHTLATLGLLNT